MQQPAEWTIGAAFQKKRHLLPGLCAVIGLLILGCCICGDYGIGWDEPAMRAIGSMNLEYARSGNDQLLAGFPDKDHGAAFEMPLLVIERLIRPASFGKVIALRHLLGFLFYVMGIWYGYRLALRLFRKQWLALSGMAMLVLQPRIFAHAFINSKDVPFMVAMLIALHAICHAFERRHIALYAFAGAVCGFAAGIRTVGILLVLLTGILLLCEVFAAGGRAARRQAAVATLAFWLSSAATLYLCWPALWRHPVDGLAYAMQRQSRYAAWDSRLLFNGRIYAGTELPWYYIPEWFVISTPLVWLLAGCCGIALAAVRVARRDRFRLRTPKQRLLFLCAACLAIPVAAVVGLGSVVYDDWRHLYFIYPPFVMLGLWGMEQIANNPARRRIILALCGLEAAAVAAFMVAAHPYQMVYFNSLVPHRPEYLRRHFDYEYWGTSYRRGLEYLLAHDRRAVIPISRKGSWPIRYTITALPPAEGRRFVRSDKDTPGTYLLTNYRLHPDDYPFPKVWSIMAGGSTVLQIYRVDTGGRTRP